MLIVINLAFVKHVFKMSLVTVLHANKIIFLVDLVVILEFVK